METTVQYFHNYNLGRTYAVDIPFNKEDLLECVHNFNNPIGVKVGIAYLNPKDKHYNKKIGREVSKEAIENCEFKLSTITQYEDKSFVYLCSETLHLTFRVFKNSEKPHLIQVVDFV